MQCIVFNNIVAVKHTSFLKPKFLKEGKSKPHIQWVISIAFEVHSIADKACGSFSSITRPMAAMYLLFPLPKKEKSCRNQGMSNNSANAEAEKSLCWTFNVERYYTRHFSSTKCPCKDYTPYGEKNRDYVLTRSLGIKQFALFRV